MVFLGIWKYPYKTNWLACQKSVSGGGSSGSGLVKKDLKLKALILIHNKDQILWTCVSVTRGIKENIII